MKKLILATTNKHKADEIINLISGSCNEEYEIQTLLDYPEIPEVIEDGETFESNALKKARQIYSYTGGLVMADDSGLEVDALGGNPGVFSARFAGPGATSEMLCNKVLEMLAMQSDRTARFKCVIAIVGDGFEKTVEGTVEGLISKEAIGEQGFGYDPVFFYPPAQKTFAQMSQVEKSQASHRGQAMRRAVKLLQL